MAACNPPGANYPAWAAAAAPGSWLARILKASHGTFIDSGLAAADAAADAVCVPGGVSHHAAAQAAAAQATAWFDDRLASPDPKVAALQAEYVGWAKAQAAWMEWGVKA